MQSATTRSQVCLYDRRDIAQHLPRLTDFVSRRGQVPLSRHPAWLCVLEQGLSHTPYCLEAINEGKTCGLLPIAFVHSFLFGRFLVSLPYLNYGGVLADDPQTAAALVDGAVKLADRLQVRFLEMRHEEATAHAAFNHATTARVHMRRDLPQTAGKLWDCLDGKVRNQVRKGQKNGLTVAWGGEELLPDFYSVFSTNMRDLGTPVYGKRLFRSILRQFPGRAELCVVRAGNQAISGSLLQHGWGISEVPSASSLRSFNNTCANMLMYWHLLTRAIERQQSVFDFGRCKPDGATYRFKKQWGAVPSPSIWQYYGPNGAISEMRPENAKYRRLIDIWKRLPVSLTRWLGPRIVRGIP